MTQEIFSGAKMRKKKNVNFAFFVVLSKNFPHYTHKIENFAFYDGFNVADEWEYLPNILLDFPKWQKQAF